MSGITISSFAYFKYSIFPFAMLYLLMPILSMYMKFSSGNTSSSGTYLKVAMQYILPIYF